MATYTMPLRAIVEHYTQQEEGLSNNIRIEASRKHIFSFDYPFYDDNLRRDFETNFIRNFYFREIGFETEEMFKMRLENWLNIHMPYWNKMFESELIHFDPMINSQMVTAYDLDSKDKSGEKSDMTQNVEGSEKHQRGLEDATKEKEDTTETSERDRKLDIDTERERDNERDLDIERDYDRDQTKDTDRNRKTDTDVSGDEQRDTTTDIDTKSDGEHESTTKQDNFGRNIESENPDSRLELTSKDGEGVIEYADDIKENTTKNKETTDGSEKASSESNEKSKDTNEYESTSNEKLDEEQNEKENETQDEKQQEDETENEKETSSESHKENEQTGRERGKTNTIDYTSDLDSKGSDTRDTTRGETTSTENYGNKKYLERKYGKIGNETYSKMLQDYRASFLRIQYSIFKEMEELFMMVY